MQRGAHLFVLFVQLAAELLQLGHEAARLLQLLVLCGQQTRGGVLRRLRLGRALVRLNLCVQRLHCRGV